MSQSNPMHHANDQHTDAELSNDNTLPGGGEVGGQGAPDTTLTSLNAMGGLVIHWHATQMERCLRMLELPEGTEMEFEDSDKPGEITNIPMTGDALKAFRVGVLTAMNLFETLPFVATEKTEQPDPAAESASDAIKG